MMDMPTSGDTAVRFSTTTRAIHWLTVLLLMGSFALV